MTDVSGGEEKKRKEKNTLESCEVGEADFHSKRIKDQGIKQKRNN